MAIFHLKSSYVESHRFGVHIWPPDGKRTIDEDAEIFSFVPSLNGARALNDAEVSLLLRSKVVVQHKRKKPLHIAGIHGNLLIVSQQISDLITEMSPGLHQIMPLTNLWYAGEKEPAPGLFCAVLILDYAHTVDLDRADVQRHYLEHLGQTAIWLSSIFPETCLIRAATGQGRHIWADNPTGAVFCSDTFRKRVLALAGLPGAVFAGCTET